MEEVPTSGASEVQAVISKSLLQRMGVGVGVLPFLTQACAALLYRYIEIGTNSIPSFRRRLHISTTVCRALCVVVGCRLCACCIPSCSMTGLVTNILHQQQGTRCVVASARKWVSSLMAQCELLPVNWTQASLLDASPLSRCKQDV